MVAVKELSGVNVVSRRRKRSKQGLGTPPFPAKRSGQRDHIGQLELKVLSESDRVPPGHRKSEVL